MTGAKSGSRVARLVREAIEKLRLKLLDLTNRNRLLNFKFTETSRKFVRIVDSTLDAHYSRLTDDSTNNGRLNFASLPEPPAPPPLELVLTDSDPSSTATPAASTRSGWRSRRAIDPTTRVEPADWARTCGIDPSFELRATAAGVENGKAGSRHLQTLLFPEAFERTLSAIREDAGLAQQELGFGTLYAAFGYLEWYESASSDEPMYSPLFMLPVEIGRELIRNEYRYFIECGENADPTINISLRERLKRDFGFELPDLEEDDSPETYLDRVATAIREQARWKIKRYVVIGHFSFARLVMYQDLNADLWIAAPLDANPLLSTLLAGAPEGSAQSSPEEYDVDDESIERLVPVCVTDADSSQFSALVDAMQGRSFALRGPPGTGKSQTITNLIAAALAAGKRVLFVAEKQPALEVVANRLVKAGLGPYLLELHSTKVQKRRVLEALKSRLELQRRRAEVKLPNTLQELRQTRAKLKAYADAMNTVVGQSELTLHDIYWHEQMVRGTLLPAEIKVAVRLEDVVAAGLTRHDYTNLRALLGRLSKAYSQCVIGHGAIQDHPLMGLQDPGVGPTAQEQLRRRLGSWNEALERLERTLEHFASAFHIKLTPSTKAVAAFSATVLGLPSIPKELDLPLLAQVRDEEGRAELARTVSLIRQVLDARLDLAQSFSELDAAIPGAKELFARARRLHASWQKLSLANIELQDLPGAVDKKERELAAVDSVVDVLDRLASTIGVARPITGRSLSELAEATRLMRSTAPEVIAARAAPLYAAETSALLLRWAEEAKQLQSESDRLLEEVSLTFAEPVTELRAASGALLDATPFFAVFSSTYRSARRLWRRLSKRPWGGRQAAAQLLSGIADLLERRNAFEAQEALKAVAGATFAGIATPFSVLLATVNYWQAVRSRWPSLDPNKAPIQRLLLEGDRTLLGDLAARIGAQDSELLEEFCRGMDVAPDETVVSRVKALHGTLAHAKEDVGLLLRTSCRRTMALSEATPLFEHLAGLAEAGGALNTSRYAVLAGINRRPTEADVTHLKTVLDTATTFLQANLPASLTTALLSEKCPAVLTAVRRFAELLTEGCQRCVEEQAALERECGHKTLLWCGSGTTESVTIAEQRARISRARSVSDETLHDWGNFRELMKQAGPRGIARFAQSLEEGTVRPESLADFFRLTYLRSLIRHVNVSQPELPTWTGEHMEGLRVRLIELDDEYMRLSRKAVAATLLANEVPVGISRGAKRDLSEKSLLEHEIGKQRKHISIRDLMRRSAGAIRALKPCFMMSPASVAQFLAADGEPFDLAIVDEASQLKLEEAMGTVARAKQIVVVGDPMQLPPTTFFDTGDGANPGSDDDDQLDVDMESILDKALSSFSPSRSLNWHYRSKHHSLVAFSNREFYDDNLIVFPSPKAQALELGVQLIHVPNGIYRSSVNATEADAVVETAIKVIRAHPDSSLGVVAINQPQKELLRERFDQLFAEDPLLEAYRARWSGSDSLEPFFVKNLENVQGDERDTIIISTVYGPSEGGGPVAQRFGPINSKMGHRRLNVLFTRAKERVIVVSSMSAEDIKPTAGSSRGVVALKNYLNYARSGRLDGGKPTGRSFDSPFEAEVAAVLTQLGYQAEPQVGVAGFFVDLGVRHRIQTDNFVLGIECDGASYHSAKSARDRDRIREEILIRLGWKLYRIWSTDWYHSREREIRKLEERLKAIGEA
jgi:very-short-patch-repair endonuclease